MRIYFYLLLLVGLLSQLPAEDDLAYRHAEKRIESLNFQARFYSHSNQEILLLLTRYQDALRTFLKDSDSVQSYHRGMRKLYNRSNRVRHASFYSLKEINFYEFTKPERKPHPTETIYHDHRVTAFYNSFKINTPITAAERQAFQAEEEAEYLRDRKESPFELTEATLQALQPETLYNFVLRPDDTVTIALEQPNRRNYPLDEEEELAKELFTHPNHSILAGDSEQVLITAGAFLFYEHEGKRLYFVANKSGHFRPYILSLAHFRNWLASCGVDPSTVILLPDVHIANFLVAHYEGVEVPVSLTQEDGRTLLQLAKEEWLTLPDVALLQSIAEGKAIDTALKRQLVIHRDQLVYLRNAYRLFSRNHCAPKHFHRLVKCYGKLKDALNNNLTELASTEAEKLLELLSREILTKAELIADEVSMHDYLEDKIAEMHGYLDQEQLLTEDYHKLKRSARELATLFHLLALLDKGRGEAAFLYKGMSTALFRVNDDMAPLQDALVKNVLEGRISAPTYVSVPKCAAKKLKKHLNQIVLEPLRVRLQIPGIVAACIYSEGLFTWAMTHFSGLTDRNVRPALEKIAKGQPVGVSPHFSDYLKVLLQSSHIASTACKLLDASGSVPVDLQNYIEQIKCIQQTGKGEVARFLDPLWVEFLKHSPLVPVHELKDRLIAIQQSMHTLASHAHLERDRLQRHYEDIEQLAVLFELYKRSRRGFPKPHPDVLYDSMSRRINELLVDIQYALDGADGDVIEVGSEIRDVTKSIADRLDI